MANPIVQQINAELEILQKELVQFKSTVDYLNNAKATVNVALQSVNQSQEHFDKKVEELKSSYSAFIRLTDSVSEVVAKIETINFPERLDSIEKSVKETISHLNETRKDTIEELQIASQIITEADFEGRFKKLQSSIDLSVDSNRHLALSIEKEQLGAKIEEFERLVSKRIHESYKEVIKNTEHITTEIAKSIHDLNLPIRIDKLDANITGILTAIQSVQIRIDGIERNIIDRLKDIAEYQKETRNVLQTSLSSIANSQEKAIKKQQISTYITWTLIIINTILIIILCLPKH